jgi:hypothetical protein
VGIIKDLTGQRFGSWTVLTMTAERRGRNVVWLCRCDCGQQVYVDGGNLRSGISKNCGCHRRDVLIACNAVHGLASRENTHELFHTWLHMIDRCENPNNPDFYLYGGHRIPVMVCERWRTSFPNFLADMGERPSPKHSIDRYPDTNGNYEKSNCRWATPRQQRRNQRKSPTCGTYETPNGTYVSHIGTPEGLIYLGAFKTQSDALVVRKQAELARAKDIAIRRGEGGGLIFIDRGVRLARTALFRLIYPYYDGDQLAA